MGRKAKAETLRSPHFILFRLLLTCISRQALDLARNFLPLPSYTIVYTHFGTGLYEVESNLTDISKVDLQIAELITANDLLLESLISLSIDAMAMTSDEHYLPAQDSDHAFVFYAQLLYR
jgi:hypothetical protein